jgi:DNA-directed RNA polymerase specialized sigma24 family protein
MAIGDGNETRAFDRAQLDDALRRMPRRQRMVLLAVRDDDATYADIAEGLRLTKAEVKRLFAQALVNLDRNLADPRRGRWRRWLPS